LDAPQLPGNTGPSGHADDLDIADRPLDNPAHQSHSPFDLSPGDVEDLWLQDTIHLSNLKTAAEFVKGLQGVTLDNPSLGMSDEALHRLWNPPHKTPPVVIDKVTRLAIDLYLENPLDTTYKTNCKAIQRFNSNIELLSYYKIKCLVANLTGVESVMHHMCINSCLAYTGPFMDLDACPVCSEPRYDQFYLGASSGRNKIPRKEFHTIPIGLQLQALYRSPESASLAHYLRNERYRIIADLE